MGEEKDKLIQQNRKQAQPPIHTDEPLNVVFVSANLTPTDSKLEIRGPEGRDLRPARRQRQRHLPGGAADRHLHGQRRRHPRRQTGHARRRLVPRLLPERRPAALSLGPTRCIDVSIAVDAHGWRSRCGYSPAASRQRPAISPASSRGGLIWRTSPSVLGARRANSKTVDMRRQRLPRVPVIPTSLS